jgi:hypothetical protein
VLPCARLTCISTLTAASAQGVNFRALRAEAAKGGDGLKDIAREFKRQRNERITKVRLCVCRAHMGVHGLAWEHPVEVSSSPLEAWSLQGRARRNSKSRRRTCPAVVGVGVSS